MRKVLIALLSICVVAIAIGRGAESLLGQAPRLSTRPVPKEYPNPARPETIPLKTFPVKFDKEYGAAIARLGEGKYGEGRLVQMDATLVELPPGGTLPAHKHLYEEMIYIVSGKGYTNIWPAGSNGAAKKKRYDWSATDVLSPSLNAWHETVNASSTEPARFVVMTAAPLLRRMFGDISFATKSDQVFEDRWNKGLQEPKYLERPGRNGGKVDMSLMSIGHFIPNMASMKMPIAFGDPTYPEEGINVVPPTDASKGSDALGGMAGNRMFEWQNREYIIDKAGTHELGTHHHSWEVVYICPKGDMETYLTPLGKGQTKRTIKWSEGDLMITEADEIHQHYSEHKGTRFLQFKLSGYFRGVGIGGVDAGGDGVSGG